MKVRLTGINEEYRGDGYEPQTMTFPPPPRGKIVMARLAGCDSDGLTYLGVPAEMVRGAEIGDEFTLHLERTNFPATEGTR